MVRDEKRVQEMVGVEAGYVSPYAAAIRARRDRVVWPVHLKVSIDDCYLILDIQYFNAGYLILNTGFLIFNILHLEVMS